MKTKNTIIKLSNDFSIPLKEMILQDIKGYLDVSYYKHLEKSLDDYTEEYLLDLYNVLSKLELDTNDEELPF